MESLKRMKRFRAKEKYKDAIDEKVKNLKPVKRIFMETNCYSVKFAKQHNKILAAGDESGNIWFIDVTKAGEKFIREDPDFKARIDEYD